MFPFFFTVGFSCLNVFFNPMQHFVFTEITMFDNIILPKEHISSVSLCGVMSISNYWYPEWHMVGCQEKIKADVCCEELSAVATQKHEPTTQVRCPQDTFIHLQDCLVLSRDIFLPGYSIVTNNTFDKTAMEQFKNTHITNISKLNEGRIVFAFPTLDNTKDVIIEHTSPLDKLTSSEENKDRNWTNVLKLYTHYTHINNTIMGRVKKEQVMLCSSGEYVSWTVVHDAVNDCVSGSDEPHMQCLIDGNVADSSSNTLCMSVCSKPRCDCPPLYYQLHQGGCSPFRHIGKKPHPILIPKATGNFQSKRTSHSDCGPDELKTLKALLAPNAFGCDKHDHIQCTFGCAKCYPLSKMCVYELDSTNNLKFCPSGSHLKPCGKMECNNMFSCLNYYCTPFR